MNISDNIIKESLKNVYFLAGGAYGGKTTMAKLIEKKHGFIRYREGDLYDNHAAIADEKYQPTIYANQFRYKDWHSYFAAQPSEYSKILDASSAEDAEFAVADLIKLSAKYTDKRIIADVSIPPSMLLAISDYSRVVLLFAPEEMTRKHYFDRDDKQDVYNLIKSFPDGDEVMRNVIEALHYKSEEHRREYFESGFLCIERRDDDTIERTLELIERHFGLV